MLKLKILITSTREQRVGPPVAYWFNEYARQHGKFEVELIDLKEVNLPLLDEPNHPMKRQYQHEHTKRWSQKVDDGDAFVFVVPEYNYGMPPALLNAIDYLYHEWSYKPAAFVSYGGGSGGLRSAQMAKQVLPTVKVMPIPEGVGVPFFTKQINAEGKFEPNEGQLKQATTLLDELLRWAEGLQPMRKK